MTKVMIRAQALLDAAKKAEALPPLNDPRHPAIKRDLARWLRRLAAEELERGA